jgi:hypothetical protein
MGAWGTGLFSDDTAADVRDGYRELVGDGYTGPRATDALLKQWGDALADSEDAPVFWLALASTQWQCGRLEPRVKAKALKVIKDGSDLRRWQDDPKLLKKRRAVLAKLQTQLHSPQPPEKRIPRRYRDTCDWEVGEVIGYRAPSGEPFVFRVIGHHTDQGGTSPVCELLDWSGTELPSKGAVRKLKGKGPPFMLTRLKEKDLPVERVTRLGVKSQSKQKADDYTILIWSHLEDALREYLEGEWAPGDVV